MMKTRRYQRGLTTLGWLLLIVVLSTVTLTGLKLAPIYLEHFAVTGSMESLRDAPAGELNTAGAVRSRLLRMFEINSVERVDRSAITVSPLGGGSYEVIVDYEVRTPYIGNIDLVVFFQDAIEVRGR